uniref:Peptidase S1 domain-containing protein n=1 Tax=Anopheles epiroticus TaxID=199890 RepID=A0A182PQY5_9DIPT
MRRQVCAVLHVQQKNNNNSDDMNTIDIRKNEESECPHYLHVCCEQPFILDTPIPDVLNFSNHRQKSSQPTCGVRNVNGIGFRIAGNANGESDYGEFPWKLTIMITLTIRAGEWDTQTQDELYPYQDRKVAKVIIHEAFDTYPNANDIALLILLEPFKLAENVQPICLPPKGTSIAKQGTCCGVGGSPLVCKILGSSNRYYQAGISSWGQGGNDTKMPAVDSNVALFRDWIDEQLAQLSIPTQDYVYT